MVEGHSMTQILKAPYETLLLGGQDPEHLGKADLLNADLEMYNFNNSFISRVKLTITLPPSMKLPTLNAF